MQLLCEVFQNIFRVLLEYDGYIAKQVSSKLVSLLACCQGVGLSV